MSDENRCPQCGAEMAADAPQGLCPRCLMQRGLESQATTSGAGGPPAADFVLPAPAELAPHFPDLEILELLGRGGMGVVYRARQKRLDRLVALKILSPKVAGDPAFAERFAREARAMAILSHPHIVTVYDFGQTDASLAPGTERSLVERGTEAAGPLYYFLMEFVDGLNLRQLLDSGKLAPPEALAIVPQICEALQYAHDHGIVHRDIKPENILLGKSGQVKIADFGLAKLMGRQPSDLTLTGAGQVMGTPHYMAPEQTEHPQDVDHRADIYSLGVVFYQMLTGELPLGRFAPPSKKVQIDVRLDEVVLRALEKEPELRYQQASEIKNRVETIVTTPSEIAATAASLPSRRPAKRSRMFGIPLVSIRDGRRVVYWPGVWLAAAMLAVGGPLLVVLAYISFAYLFAVPGPGGRLGPSPVLLLWGQFLVLALFFGWALGFVMLIVKAREGLAAPVEPPAPPDRVVPPAHVGRSTTGAHEAIEQARHQVRGPAIGLLATGMLNWWMILPIIGLVSPTVYALTRGSPGNIMVLVLISLMIISTLLIFAALRMKRLQSYGLAILASILAMIVSPGNLIGLPIGIWALVVLSQREVSDAFARTRRIKPARRPVTCIQRRIGLAALLLCGASFPLLLLGRTWLIAIALSLSLQLAALTLGIIGRRSLAGKAAAILVIPCVLLGPLAACRLYSVQAGHDFGGSPSAEFHYRVFEGDAALVDKLIPAAQRKSGAQPGVAFSDHTGVGVGSTMSRGDFSVSTHGGAIVTDSQMAEISLATLGKLLGGIGQQPGLLADETRTVSSGWWPRGSADTWIYVWAVGGLANNGGGTGFLGFRRENGQDEIRIEYFVNHDVDKTFRDLSAGLSPQSLQSRFSYEGRIPHDGALAFLVPYFRRDDSAHYLVFVYEISPVNATLAVVDIAAHPGGPWLAPLPGGINAELVGVGENNKDNRGRWWRPDGSPLADRPYETLGGFVFPLGEDTLTREFAVRLGNLPAEPVGTRWQFEPSGGAAAGGDTPQAGPATVRAIAKALPATARTVNVRFGAAAGPWQFVAEGPGGEAHGLPNGVGIAFAKPYEKEGGAIIVISHTVTDRETRVIAVGTDGRQHRPGRTEIRNVAGVSQITATFLNLAMKDVRAFRLQARPYAWVEFRNVAIWPQALKTSPKPAISSAGAERPQLRFLAWQDEHNDQGQSQAWHADGTLVVEQRELDLLRFVLPTKMIENAKAMAEKHARFLCLWFSHPGIDRQSYGEVTLLDAAEKPLPLASFSFASNSQPPAPASGMLGWITYTLSPGAVGRTPPTANVRLRFSAGPWSSGPDLEPTFRGVVALGHGSTLNGIGQTAADKAFVAIAESAPGGDTAGQIGFVAITKDGRELDAQSGIVGGPSAGPYQTRQFEFDAPLATIQVFRSRTRPIETVKFCNVSLQPGQRPR